MDAIGITNLRSLKDTGMVQLKPLTLLLGKNSSGKSTFLRTFPLLRQSYEVNTSGPILWNGPLVDFGNFAEAHYRGSSSKEPISLSFKWNQLQFHDELLTIDLSVNMLPRNNGTTKLDSLDLEFHDHRASIQFADDGIVNGWINQRHHEPMITRFPRGLIPFVLQDRNLFDAFFAERGLPADALPLNTWSVAPSKQMFRTLPDLVQNADFKHIIQSWQPDHPDFCELMDLQILSSLAGLYELLYGGLYSTAGKSIYSAPVRADAKRYYRLQELAVNEVDFQGSNLAMFISSLSELDQADFAAWMDRHFHFAPKIHLSEGHASIRLRETGSKHEYNLTDMGFGFSQALPVLTQLWALRRRPLDLAPPLFAIEQPELHLHPALQAQLADAFVATVNEAEERGKPLRLIVETHSETMVNRIGHQIAEGKMAAENVNVVLFEKDGPDAPTTVRQSSYDEEGFLTNWPRDSFFPSWCSKDAAGI